LFGAKLLAYTKRDPTLLAIDLEKINHPGGEGKEGAVFIHTSPPGVSATTGPGATCEKRLVVGLLESNDHESQPVSLPHI